MIKRGKEKKRSARRVKFFFWAKTLDISDVKGAIFPPEADRDVFVPKVWDYHSSLVGAKKQP